MSVPLQTPSKNVEQWNWAQMYKIPPDILDDLCSRFIVNVPEEERKDLVRLFFQIELAHWFYIDFYCSEENSTRKQCNIKEFSANIFKHLSFLHKYIPNFERHLEQFREYKQAVPTFGAILLNEELTHVLLVQGFWSKSSWGFPKGKVNEGEDPARCAVREVLEETGFDISHLISVKEFLETTVNDQLTRLYIIPGVPHETKFIPRTRNEIRALQWFPIADLPNSKKDAMTKVRLGIGSSSFFMVFPFVRLIRNWVSCRITYKQQQSGNGNNRRTKQRRKSLEEQSITGILQRLPKPSSEDDAIKGASAANAEMFYQRLSKSAAHPSSSASTQIPQGGFSVKKGKTPSRRQLFTDKTQKPGTPQGGISSTASTAVIGDTYNSIKQTCYVAPSWLNFKLNMAPILACFD
ncbi:m7GpppN-mRNA hydrolase-like [Daphnia pulex]|uniref:m7GpppN-mRNA hydrolase-like n=1 Tax=Daphnia pulex TaxID=6669 RepID=UPI001EDE5433|nr:m7GpppN-mRNA hydrolase-like [Daphnia pulex]